MSYSSQFLKATIGLIIGISLLISFDYGRAQEEVQRYGAVVQLNTFEGLSNEMLQPFANAVPAEWLVPADTARYRITVRPFAMLIESCEYGFGVTRTLERYEVWVGVEITDIVSDEIVLDNVFVGEPARCGNSEEFGEFEYTKEVYGLPDAADITAWLNTVVVDIPDLVPPVTDRVLSGVAGAQIFMFEYDELVKSAAYNANGRTLVVFYGSNHVSITDATSGASLTTITLADLSGIQQVTHSPNRAVLIVRTSNGVYFINAASGATLEKLYFGNTNFAGFTADGTGYVLPPGGHVVRLHPCVGCDASNIDLDVDEGTKVDFAPDAEHLAVSGSGTLTIINVARERSVQSFAVHELTINSMRYSPDGRYIVTASDDKTAAVWDIETGTTFLQLAHPDRVLDANFRPDGRYIVTACQDGIARVWDAATGEEVLQLEGHTSRIGTASFSPDGRTVVTASTDKTVRIWDVSTLGE